MPDKTREEMIVEIVAIYRQLRELKVFPREIKLNKASDEELEIEIEAVGDQLKRRKEFLGVEI